jgi:type IV pilus assembly protein PilN
MIRINLLATERRVEKAAEAAARPAAAAISPAYVFLALGVLAGLGLSALGWLWQTRQLSALNTEIADLQAREKQLQAVKAQVDAFEAKKKMLIMKVELIERLKAEQSSPVHMLDEISKALPDFVWLTNLEQTGNSLKFTGESSSLTSIADFISNLQRSGWFPQVELVSSDEQAPAGGGTSQSIVKFVLQGNFVNPEVAAKAAASPSPAPPAAGARKS